MKRSQDQIPSSAGIKLRRLLQYPTNMTTPTRIVSFLPAATEMAGALGLIDQLVGITHECDYPLEVRGKTIVVRNPLPIRRMSQSEIDVAVAQRMRDGLSLYQV